MRGTATFDGEVRSHRLWNTASPPGREAASSDDHTDDLTPERMIDIFRNELADRDIDVAARDRAR